MKFVRPNGAAYSGGNDLPNRPLWLIKCVEEQPAWLVKWLEDQGKWVQLECGCIIDVHIPQALTVIIRKPIEIACEKHGFKRVKKNLTFKEVITRRIGIVIPEDSDPEGLFPPF